jgi:mannitol/fructose-specific phosphotransferase system IIA component (Ntr-type)
MLEKYLTADHIRLKLKAVDWRDAIKLAAFPLLSSEKLSIGEMQSN